MLSRQKAMNDLRSHLLAVAPIEGATLDACQRSNKEIWKSGLSYDSRELDVIFGELRPEHFFLSGVNPKLMDAYCRSIVIPKSRAQLQVQGAKGDGNRSMFLNRDGLQVPKSTLDGGTARLPVMENQRFKAYLRKYFPHDNVIVQPMDQIMQNLMLAAELGTIRKFDPRESYDCTPVPPSPTRPRMREKMLKFVSVHDLSDWEDRHLESPGGAQCAWGITEGTCQRADGEQAHQTMDVQKPPSPTHLSIKEKYMQSASLSLLSNGQGEDTDRAEVGVMARIPIGGRKLLLKKEYAKKRKKEIELMQLEQALGRIETGAGEEVGEVNPNRYERLPPPTPQHRVITVRQKGRTNFANKNCEYYRQVMENFSKRRKRKREQRRETLIGLANLYSSLSEEMCSVVSENPTPNYALASLRQHQQDPRYRSSSAAVADRSILQATPIGRLPRARSEQAVVEEAAAASSKMLSQAEIEDYFVLLQGQRPNVPLANTDPRSLICSRQSSCSQLLGVNLQNMDRVSSLPPSSPPQPPINSAVMKAGDGENAGVDGVAEGTFQCPPGMENLWKALSDDLAHAQACLVCALLLTNPTASAKFIAGLG
uniref:Uncharacterized protein n=2 Tax=Schistocephalus solidus TaxID=70667 RepID=A0A0X3NH51_SCHSO